MATKNFNENGNNVKMSTIIELAHVSGLLVDSAGIIPNPARNPAMAIVPCLVIPTRYGNMYVGYFATYDDSNRLNYMRRRVEDDELFATFEPSFLLGGGNNYDTIIVNGAVADKVIAAVHTSNLNIRVLVG